jgi:hypothetical protein
MDLAGIVQGLRNGSSPVQIKKLKTLVKSHPAVRWLVRSNLTALSRIHETDKWGNHWYTEHYQAHFQRFRHRRLNLLEIGVGGFDDPRAGGKSMRMWKDFFPRAQIFGLDLYDKSGLQEPRIRIFQGSQADPEFLTSVARQIGRIDIIVDDGSHQNEHVLISFQTLFPLLAAGGFYAIEDLQTAYDPGFGGSTEPDCQATSIAMCKQLVDSLNWKAIAGRVPSYTDSHLASIHFYPELVIIQKSPERAGER